MSTKEKGWAEEINRNYDPEVQHKQILDCDCGTKYIQTRPLQDRCLKCFVRCGCKSGIILDTKISPNILSVNEKSEQS